MQSERKTKKHWGLIVFLFLTVAVLAGVTVYLLGIKGDWQDDIRKTMESNVEFGGKMSLVQETRNQRIEFFLRRSIRELPHKTVNCAAGFIQSLSVMSPPFLEYRELAFKPRLHSSAFSLKGHFKSESYELFDAQWQVFLNRLERELPLLDFTVTLPQENVAEGDFIIEGELELQ